MMESIAQQAAKDARDVFSDDRQAQAAIGYMEQLIYAALRNVEYDLSDPVTVHANMLRGTIAKPTVEQIVHLYGREAFQPMIDASIAKALEKACLAVSEHADWPEDEHGRTEQVGLFARVINAIRAITLTDAIAALPARGVGVKPLVWHEANDGNYRKGECFTTRSPISFAPIAAHKKHDGWWLNVDCKTYPTLDAAKAAAQADYEARILAALEPAPAAQAREAAADELGWNELPENWEG